ncbi:MAG: hypothetical protein ACI88L_000114 [Candidatus Paceibacteria bacterium]|jgi:hypothetical protein
MEKVKKIEKSADPTWADHFREVIIHGRKFEVHFTTRGKISDWFLLEFGKVTLQERVYHIPGKEWITVETLADDVYITKGYAIKHGKGYAKYRIIHEDYDFYFIIYKNLKNWGAGYRSPRAVVIEKDGLEFPVKLFVQPVKIEKTFLEIFCSLFLP